MSGEDRFPQRDSKAIPPFPKGMIVPQGLHITDGNGGHDQAQPLIDKPHRSATPTGVHSSSPSPSRVKPIGLTMTSCLADIAHGTLSKVSDQETNLTSPPGLHPGLPTPRGRGGGGRHDTGVAMLCLAAALMLSYANARECLTGCT
jgi:hypothetical protein